MDISERDVEAPFLEHLAQLRRRLKDLEEDSIQAVQQRKAFLAEHQHSDPYGPSPFAGTIAQALRDEMIQREINRMLRIYFPWGE